MPSFSVSRILPLSAALCCAAGLPLSAVPSRPEAAATTPAMSIDSTAVSPRDPRIQYMGRLAFAGDAEAKLGFPGVTIRFAYRGPAPTIRRARLVWPLA